MGYGNVSERRMAPPEVGVSVVILALRPPEGDGGIGADADDATESGRGCLWLPLVRRTRQPYLGAWALPGGSIRADETLETSAFTALASTTDLHPRYLEQLYTFSGPDRSRGALPMVTVAYWALVGVDETRAHAPRQNVAWFPESALPNLDLAFDHRAIIDYALERLKTKIELPDIAARLVGETFTLGQLHAVYEAVGGQTLDLANFRRKMLASGVLEDTGDKLREGRQRPATVYRYIRREADAPWNGLWNRNEIEPAGEGSGEYNRANDALAALMPSR